MMRVYVCSFQEFAARVQAIKSSFDPFSNCGRYARETAMNATEFLVITAVFFCSRSVFAQAVDKEPEPAAIMEVGGAAAWDLKGGGSSFGGDLAIEFTPIEKWLEIEGGTTPLFRRHSTEWDTDLLFKKPWTLSEKVEFMFGVGPEWIHARTYGVASNAVGGEVVLDFMFWPSSNHRFGWFLEPGYDYSFARGHERSMGISGGLLIAIPRRR
jgi:hypothetical protein